MTSLTSVDFSKKSLIFITGASKGIGRTIAVELSRITNQHSIFVLIARSEQGLEETKELIGEVDKSITVLTYSLDLGAPDLEKYEGVFDDVLANIDTTGVEIGAFFHNAAYVGTLKQTSDLTDLKEWSDYFAMNLYSATLLNSVFVKKSRSIAPQLVVVNITSKCGRVPFANMAMYGSGKAARELFFKVFALEEPQVIVLNYSPGPVDTDMFSEVCESAQSEQVKSTFSEIKESSILSATQSVEKMLELLKKGDFDSGETVDYYDD